MKAFNHSVRLRLCHDFLNFWNRLLEQRGILIVFRLVIFLGRINFDCWTARASRWFSALGWLKAAIFLPYWLICHFLLQCLSIGFFLSDYARWILHSNFELMISGSPIEDSTCSHHWSWLRHNFLGHYHLHCAPRFLSVSYQSLMKRSIIERRLLIRRLPTECKSCEGCRLGLDRRLEVASGVETEMCVVVFVH